MRCAVVALVLVALVGAVSADNPAAVASTLANVPAAANKGDGSNPNPSAVDCSACDGLNTGPDPAIDEIEEQKKKLREEIDNLQKAIAEGKACAARVPIDEAALEKKMAELGMLEKGERDAALRDKLEKEEAALNTVDKMANSLKNKFMALVRAQQEIRGKMALTQKGLMEEEQPDEPIAPPAPTGPTSLASDLASIHEAMVKSIGDSNVRVTDMVMDHPQLGQVAHDLDNKKDTAVAPADGAAAPAEAASGSGSGSAAATELVEVGSAIENMSPKQLMRLRKAIESRVGSKKSHSKRRKRHH